MPKRAAQVLGRVPEVRIASSHKKKKAIIIENKNPHVCSLIRDRVHKRIEIKKEMNRKLSSKARFANNCVFIGRKKV